MTIKLYTRSTTVAQWYGKSVTIPSISSPKFEPFATSCMGIAATLLQKRTDRNLRVALSNTIDTAYADPNKSLVVISRKFLDGNFSAIGTEKSLSASKTIGAILGVIVHEIAHFAYSPKDLHGSIDFVLSHTTRAKNPMLAKRIANILEDIYIENRIAKVAPTLSWSLDEINRLMLTEDKYKESIKILSKVSSVPTSNDYNNILNFLLFAKITAQHGKISPVAANLYKMARSVIKMDDLQSRYDLALRIYEIVSPRIPEPKEDNSGSILENDDSEDLDDQENDQENDSDFGDNDAELDQENEPELEPESDDQENEDSEQNNGSDSDDSDQDNETDDNDLEDDSSGDLDGSDNELEDDSESDDQEDSGESESEDLEDELEDDSDDLEDDSEDNDLENDDLDSGLSTSDNDDLNDDSDSDSNLVEDSDNSGSMSEPTESTESTESESTEPESEEIEPIKTIDAYENHNDQSEPIYDMIEPDDTIRRMGLDNHKVIELTIKQHTEPLETDKRYTRLAQAANQRTTVNKAYGAQHSRGRNFRQLHRIATDQKIFANPLATNAVKPMEIIILLDCSGSMIQFGANKLLPASMATLGAATGLINGKCMVNVYAHTSDLSENQSRQTKTIDIYRLMSHGESLTTLAKRLAYLNRYARMYACCNRDGYALYEMAQKFQSNNRRRMILVISDGQPSGDDNSYYGQSAMNHTKKMVERIRQTGIEVYSLSIDYEAFAPNNFIYGKDHNVCNTDPNAIDDMIRQLFLA